MSEQDTGRQATAQMQDAGSGPPCADNMFMHSTATKTRTVLAVFRCWKVWPAPLQPDLVLQQTLQMWLAAADKAILSSNTHNAAGHTTGVKSRESITVSPSLCA